MRFDNLKGREMAVHGYCRVSTLKQSDEGESLELQQRQLEGYAYQHGLKITKIEIEKGVSGSIPVEQRPVGGALFAKLEKGDIVIAAKLDRLFRSALDALNVVASLKERGVNLHLLDLGGDIAGNGLSKLFLTIAAAFAEAERDRIRERIGQSKADQKARGRYLGGKIPFGWRRDGPDGDVMVEVPEEQAAIREMIRLRLEKREPLRVVVEAMAKRGHKISHQSVVNIVKRQGRGETCRSQ
jgi:putative DNA-invertase from lambdoid prophage Rac